MAPCRPFLFISFSCGFRLSSSNQGFFFGCGVQLAPHSFPPDSLRFPSIIPFFGSGRPSGAGSPSSITLQQQQELTKWMHGFSHKPARVVCRAYLASTRQHQHQENENHPPPGRQQRAGVPFVSVELRDHQLAQGREPRLNRAMEQSLLRSWLPSCRGAFGSPL